MDIGANLEDPSINGGEGGVFPCEEWGLAFFKADVLDGDSEAMHGDGGMGALEMVLDDAEVQ